MKHFGIHCRILTVYTAEYCLYIFLFLGFEGGHGTAPLLRTLVPMLPTNVICSQHIEYHT